MEEYTANKEPERDVPEILFQNSFSTWEKRLKETKSPPHIYTFISVLSEKIGFSIWFLSFAWLVELNSPVTSVYFTAEDLGLISLRSQNVPLQKPIWRAGTHGKAK